MFDADGERCDWWLEKTEIGWMVHGIGSGWFLSYGPYRSKFLAWLLKVANVLI